MIFNFGIKDAIDILLVAFFLYQTYKIMKKTGTTAIFLGVLAFIAIWMLVSRVFEMQLIGAILDQFMSVGFILLAIIFQKELREFLQSLGSNKGVQFISKLFTPKIKNGVEKDISYIMPIVMATMDMAKRKEGALIAIQQQIPLNTFVETGETLNADISSQLIQNVFFKNSPLHDGAMIIVGEKIKAASCILPVSQKHDIPKQLGLRHRSAIGLSEETDAKIIIVSEESGKISMAHNGHLYLNISPDELQNKLISKE